MTEIVEKVKKGDFIEIDYDGKLPDGTIFDSTDAKKLDHEEHEGHEHGPAIICIGEHQVLAGLDHFLDIRKSYANVYEKEFSNFKGCDVYRHTLSSGNDRRKTHKCNRRVSPLCFLMHESSVPSMNLTRSVIRPTSYVISLYTPSPSSTRLSLICSNHFGCVKSPVDTISIPFLTHPAAIFGNSKSREHALEYFEWMWRSRIFWIIIN